jgi:uncharacterized protein (UPF0276 family)
MFPQVRERTTAAADDALQAAAPGVPKLGIGLSYQGQLRPFLEKRGSEFDFLEVVPEVVWNDLGPGRQTRYVPDPAATAFLEEQSRRRAIIPHSIGLSIGSAHRFDREHVAQMALWHRWLDFPWHSDHLAFHLAEHHGPDAGEVNLNLTLPLPLDHETLDLVASRVAEMQASVPVPFLLENNVSYFRMPEEEYDEAEFLGALHRESGCGLLLDLHNVYVNERNLGIDADAFLDRLPLEAVAEIHVAGGMEMDGFYLDAHSGPVLEPVWRMLERVLPRCPNLGGVVFELFGSWYEPMGEDGLRRQLDRMRGLWSRYLPAPVRWAR